VRDDRAEAKARRPSALATIQPYVAGLQFNSDPWSPSFELM
jgi:hypothetical protein